MSAPPLYHLVYQSTATAPFTEEALEALLIQSRAWNNGHALTGVLLYSQGDIMQVLEGPEAEVHYIFGRIEQDTRHGGVVKLADGPVARRNFSQWSMGFRAVDPRDFTHLAGYLNLTRPDYLPPLTDSDSASLHSLLASFVAGSEIRY